MNRSKLSLSTSFGCEKERLHLKSMNVRVYLHSIPHRLSRGTVRKNCFLHFPHAPQVPSKWFLEKSSQQNNHSAGSGPFAKCASDMGTQTGKAKHLSSPTSVTSPPRVSIGSLIPYRPVSRTIWVQTRHIATRTVYEDLIVLEVVLPLRS
jgi:hypothetical protein